MDGSVTRQKNHFNMAQVWSGLAALLLIQVEVSWLIPWYLGVAEVSYKTSGWRAFLVLAGNMLLAYLFTRFTENLHLKRNIQQIGLIGLFLVNLVLATKLLLDPAISNPIQGLIKLDPGPVLVVLAGAWLWWRGISLGRSIITPETVWRRFWLGIWMLVAYLLVITRVTQVQPNFIPFLVFLGTGLLALIISRIAYIHFYHGSQRNPLGRNWLVAIGASVVASTLLAAFFATLLTSQFNPFLSQLSEALRWIVAGFIFLASIPGLILTYLVSPLLEALQLFLQSKATPEPNATPYMFITPTVPTISPEISEPLTIHPLAITILFWIIVMLVTVLVFNQLKIIRSSRSDQTLEDPEILLRRNELWRKLRQTALQQLQEAGDSLRKLRVRHSKQAAYIRRIYSELMNLSETLEKPRPVGITPNEFLPTLQKAIPGVQPDLERLTEAYNRVRYGELPESATEITLLEQAWQRISAEGERQKVILLATRKHLEINSQPQ